MVRGHRPGRDRRERARRAGKRTRRFGQAALFDTAPAVDLESVAAEIAAWEREGMRLVTILDEEYPLYLRLVHQRPPFLFMRGTTVEDDLRVAVSAPARPPRRVSPMHGQLLVGWLSAASLWSVAWPQASTPPPTEPHSPSVGGPSPSSAPAFGAHTRLRTLGCSRRSPTAAYPLTVLARLSPVKVVVPYAQRGDEWLQPCDRRRGGRLSQRRPDAGTARP